MKDLLQFWDGSLAAPIGKPEAISIWNVPLQSHFIATHFYSFLTETERQRAERFRFAHVQDSFVIMRGMLRQLLGRYLDLSPTQVPIQIQDGGKPVLQGYDLQFNLSHTDGLGLITITNRGRVGIDIERLRPMENALNLVQRYFTLREQELFQKLESQELEACFFRAWTRKEAILKAIGSGVQSLDCCDVTFGLEEIPQVLRLHDDQNANHRWFLHGWQPQEGYIAAISVERC